MARALLRFSEPDAVYLGSGLSFSPLGAEMRRLQISRPIGFFLHTPWADRRTMAAVPHHADLVQAMLAYDLHRLSDRRGPSELSKIICSTSLASPSMTAPSHRLAA